jgi:hypothetical protein
VDAHHFDALARRFTRTRSRRGALRLLAGTAVTTALGRQAVTETSAKRLCPDCETGCCTGKGGTCEPGTVVEACGAGGKKCKACDAFAEVCQGGGCCVPGRGTCSRGQRCCENVPCTKGTCCSPTGGSCETADNCCDPFAETCEGGRCCVPGRGTCKKAKDCCEDVECTDGSCCSPAGGSCQTADNCCDPFAHTCEDGKCCVPEEGECKKSTECCTGKCIEGKCGCIPDLEPCPKGCKEFSVCKECCHGWCSAGRVCFE